MKRIIVRYCLAMIILLLMVFQPSALAQFPTKEQVVDAMRLVEDHWIYGHPHPGDNQWARAVHFEGTMALYDVYADEKYYDYALNWAELNKFELNEGDNTRNADNQCAGQTYLDLYRLDPAPYKLQHIKASLDGMVGTSNNYYWSWIDALEMAMPAFAKLSRICREDPASDCNGADYAAKMWDLYHHTKYLEGGNGLYSDNGNYNYQDYLWWRDDNFDPPAASPNGNMIYWSRGNGWVVAALVRTLAQLDAGDPHYDNEYVNTLQEMAASLITRQRSDGFWNLNLDDPSDYGGKETSGTALFTYALAWGINHGVLVPFSTYQPHVEAAWNALVNDAVHPNGKLGFVQGVGDRPSSCQPVTYAKTSSFGVGAFLLAGSQVYKMAGDTAPPPEQRAVYHAEDASIYHGAVENNHAGYTGAGFVNLDNETGSYLTFCVDVSGDGVRSLLMRFANGGHAGRHMDININGGGIEHDNVAFDPTGAWTSWGYQNVNVYLEDGSNTIQIISDQSFGGPNLDKIELGVPGAQSLPVWYSTPGFSAVHDLGAGNTGTVTLEFDVIPFGNAIDGVIGYADTDTHVSTWSSMAMLVRMYQNGKFEVRKEEIYTADKDVYYRADTKYHVAISADMSSSTYDVWVTPEGRCRTRIAHDFPFRSDAPATDDVGKVCLIGDTRQNFKVENHTVW